MNTETLTITEYNPIAAGIEALRSKYVGVVYPVGTREGMAEAKAAKKELTKVRTSLEAIRKEIKAPALARAKAIDSEAQAINAQIVAIEEPIARQIEAEEMRVRELERQKQEAEEKRIAAHQQAINEIRLAPSKLVGQKSASIKAVLESLQARTIEGFEEFQREAEAERTIAIGTLTSMVAGAQAQEAEQERLAAERVELERLRKKAEEDARVAEENRQRLIAAEEAAARERRAREDAEAQAARDKLDREAAERRAQEKPFAVQESLADAPRIVYPDERAQRAADFDAGTGPSTEERLLVGGNYLVLLTAMKKLREIVTPGTEEAEIVEKALFDVKEL